MAQALELAGRGGGGGGGAFGSAAAADAELADGQEAAPLLGGDGAAVDAKGPTGGGAKDGEKDDGPLTAAAVAAAARLQARLAWPLCATYLAVYSVGIINLSFLGHLGTGELAAAALGATCCCFSLR